MRFANLFSSSNSLFVPNVADGVALQARNVSVVLGGKQILWDVSLTVKVGEVLVLIGPNGSGKSTLLATFSADVSTVAGEIFLFGKVLSAWRVQEMALLRAMLLQENSLAFPFTVREVVRMGRAPWLQFSEKDLDEQIVQEAMLQTDTLRFANRRFPSLSGGERARVSLARVLAQRTPLLFLDEPTAALDIAHQELVLRLARSQAALGKAIVIVLHDLNLAAAYADRVALLEDGCLVSVGTSEEVLTAPLLSRVYRENIEVRCLADGGRVIRPVR